MRSNVKEPVVERPNVPQGYDKGRLMMEVYLTRIKANRNTTAMVDAKTNTVTKYI